MAVRLRRALTLTGTGLHSGEPARVRLLPSRGAGVVFVRTDVQPPLEIRAHVDSVVDTTLSTRLGVAGRPDATVGTVEHLLAALAGLRVRACRVEIDGPELPILDGSALPWVKALREVLARAPLGGTRSHAGSEKGCSEDTVADGIKGEVCEDVAGAYSERPVHLAAPIMLEAGGASISAVPAAALSFSYFIDFPNDAVIGRQTFDWTPPACAEHATVEFAAELAPARTFTPAAHARALQASGRRHGGGLHNALVSDGEAWLNRDAVRFVNEPVRHKLLDLIGDLALCGRPLGPMRIRAERAGHRLHVELARALLRADADSA